MGDGYLGRMCVEGRVGLMVAKVIDCGVEGGMAGSPNAPWMSDGERVMDRGCLPVVVLLSRPWVILAASVPCLNSISC